MRHRPCSNRFLATPLVLLLLLVYHGFVVSDVAVAAHHERDLKLDRIGHIDGGKRLNVVFVLTDDHRYDVMGFMGHPFVKTPQMDKMAREGVHFKNGFVTTSLCSPSRATILTGLYMHNHGIVDNNKPASEDLIYFPQYLQAAGYQTAFVGKWHFGGHSDDPRPGFDHWVSFKGQGEYFPGRNGLNVNGRRVKQTKYITDEMTDYALDWLTTRDKDRPFFLYLSHKAVHDNFSPPERLLGSYDDEKVTFPETMANTKENYAGKPMWVYNQRNSWHGVDFPYHGQQKGDLSWMYRRYCEAVTGVDESLASVMTYLREEGIDDETLVIYMGDNGFLWGEHGLIDKRNAYEESMRVPLMVYGPGIVEPGKAVDSLVANIDIAPTILEACGLRAPATMDGRSFLRLATGEPLDTPWREAILYEYYWEWNFPQTPTIFALRTDRYKLILYHGLWDSDELYDLQADPRETRNLIRDPDYRQVREDLRERLYAKLAESDGMRIPLNIKHGDGNNLREKSGSDEAKFPDHVFRDLRGE